MARTIEDKVAEVIEVDDAIDLAPFIEAASSMVDRIEAAYTSATAVQLELVERWLAAHFYTVRDPRAVTEKAGPVSATYQSSVALGLATSHYGQIAMALDPSGLLKQWSDPARAPKTASVVWAGTDPDE